MKSVTDIIADLFGLTPKPTPCPWLKPETKPDRQKETLPDNVVYYAGRPFEQQEIEVGVYEDTRLIKGQTTRSAAISPTERQNAAQKKFDAAKYAELKILWADGVSSAAAAKMFKGRKGYGVRTLETYWATFNSVGHGSEEE